MRAAGARRDFSELPSRVRDALERRLGSPVVEAETQQSGYSPGIAARVRLESGARAFVKAVGREPNPLAPGFHRREIEIVSALPAAAPVPRFLGSVDEEGWVVLAFDDVDGRHPELPVIQNRRNRSR